jgi:hypothetical protein
MHDRRRRLADVVRREVAGSAVVAAFTADGPRRVLEASQAGTGRSSDAVDCRESVELFWNTNPIVATIITRDNDQGIRVTPNVCTTLNEVDTLARSSRMWQQ